MNTVPKIPPSVRLPLPLPTWWVPAANTDVELTALDAAKRLGWRGIVGAGTEADAEGIGATLWGIARIGLPILTLGLVMEGDESCKSWRPGDFPKPQPDPKFIAELNLDFLKQQKTLAELSGNASLAQLLDIRIRGIETQHANATPSQHLQNNDLQISASTGSGSSIPIRQIATLDIDTLSPEDRKLWDQLLTRLDNSPRSLFLFLIEKNISPDNPLLPTLTQHTDANPNVEYAVAWYRMLRLMAHKPAYISMFKGVLHYDPYTLIKDIPINHMPWLWESLLTTVSRHRDALTRRFALEVTRHALAYHSRQLETFRAIADAGLQDPDPVNVWMTWRTMNQYLPTEARAVNAQDLAPQAQLTVPNSLQQGLAKYVHGTEAELRTRHEIYLRIFDDCTVVDGTMSWLNFHPIHSLADFNPDSNVRRPTVTHKQKALLQLLTDWHGDREIVLRQFLLGDTQHSPDAAKVMVLPSGRAYLVQGHHRMAALIHMVLEGQLPVDWLDHLPVRIMTYHGEIPEVIVQRILTLGIDLQWADLFPQPGF